MSDLKRFFEQIGTDKRVPRGQKRNPVVGKEVSIVFENSVVSDQDYTPGSVVSAEGADSESRWSESDGLFWRAKRTFPLLPDGLYSCMTGDNIGPMFRKKPLETDDLIILPEPNLVSIIREFELFWSQETERRFRKFGYLYKRGLLLWGPMGSGKTSLINLLMQTIIEQHHGVIIEIDNPNVAAECLWMLRKNEPQRPLITVTEDLDALVERYGEGEFLQLFDGADQVSNVLHIATTNYPQRIDKRFIDRPSRFDIIQYIGMPGKDARRAYFQHMLGKSELSWWNEDELDRWVKLSEGLSVAHMKEIIISVCCLNKELDEVVDRLVEMHERQLTSDRSPDGPKLGFGI